MELGLYKLKLPARRAIGTVLPWFRNVPPDVISWCIVPVGVATAVAYYFADAFSVLLLLGAGLIVVRMFLATLDGLVAETFRRTSRLGEVANRLPGEISDVLLLTALMVSSESRHVPGALALATGWLSSYSGLIGLTIQRPIQSVGPVGQTDRLAALVVFSMVGYLAGVLGHGFDAMEWFLIWSILGGGLTIGLRLWRVMGRQSPGGIELEAGKRR